MPEDASTGGDRMLRFAVPGRHVRGRLVRLHNVVDEIVSAHAYPDGIAEVLAEAVVLAALIGGVLRQDDGQLTLQVKGEGGQIRLLVADYRNGELRGYAAQELDRRSAPGSALQVLFGNGQLVITLDQSASHERYQGIVALAGESLHEAAEAYFANSEQLPTVLRIAARRGTDGRWTAGGLLVQHLPRGEEGGGRLMAAETGADWQHMAVLAGSVQPGELTDPSLPLDSLLWRLFHQEEVRIFPEQPLTRGCRCSEARISQVLLQFPESERAGMRDEEGVIVVDCEFCARQFHMRL